MSIRYLQARLGAKFSVLALSLATTGISAAQTTADAPAPVAPQAAPAEAAPAEPVVAAEPVPVAAPPAPAPAASGAGAPAPQAVETEEVAAQEDAIADALDQGVTEQKGKQYLFLGARYRAVFIPTFVQSLFADGGEGIVAHTPGLEFAMREDGFEYNLFAQLGMYKASDVPFKGKSDDATEWEIVDIDFQILTLGADFMWSTDEFAPGLSMTYGAGLGLGVVFGSLGRTEAFPSDGVGGDPEDYERCAGPGRPDNVNCDADGDHYDGYEEPSWADGGSSPLIFPWIAGQIGLRYKMHRNFVSRVELGVMPTGGFVGIGADYGL